MRIDRIAHSNRWRDRHPGEKLFLCGGLLVLSLLGSPFYHGPLVILITFLLAWRGAGIAPLTLVSLWILPFGFISLGLPGLLISLDMSPHFSIQWQPAGLHLAATVFLRAMSAFSAVLLFAITTPIANLVHPLKTLHIPQPVIDLVFLMHRMGFLLMESADHIHRSQKARLGYGTWRQSLHSLGLLASALLLKALDRGYRLEMGLESRGFSGSLTVLPHQTVTSSGALSAIAVLHLTLWGMGHYWQTLS